MCIQVHTNVYTSTYDVLGPNVYTSNIHTLVDYTTTFNSTAARSQTYNSLFSPQCIFHCCTLIQILSTDTGSRLSYSLACIIPEWHKIPFLGPQLIFTTKIGYPITLTTMYAVVILHHMYAQWNKHIHNTYGHAHSTQFQILKNMELKALVETNG